MEQKRLKTAMIGVGRWGTNVARELGAASELVYFASKESGADLPGAKRASVEEICADSAIEAVAIATPIATHAEIVRKVLESGKHVLCEKPLAETSAEAHALAQLAHDKGLTLMTGYVFLYHPVYQELKRFMQGTTPTRVECVWKKYGTFTESIEMNLLTHHLSLACDLLGIPEAAAITKREAGETACDRIEARLSYKEREFVSTIDRLSQEKTHAVTATFEGGSTLTWNDTKLFRNEELIFESADTPLALEIRAFLDASAGGATPLTAGDFGARVLEIHEMLQT